MMSIAHQGRIGAKLFVFEEIQAVNCQVKTTEQKFLPVSVSSYMGSALPFTKTENKVGKRKKSAKLTNKGARG